MKIVVFKGGLGNQIFQYVFYEYLQSKGYNVFYINKANGSHNGLEVNKYFFTELKRVNILIEIFLRLLYRFKLAPICRFRTEDENFNESKTLFDGYWHDKKFYIKQISFKNIILNNINQCIYNKIVDTNSVSIHVRRGDYLSPQNEKIFGGICTGTYYNKAIAEIEKRLKNIQYFIFSNDIEWCKNNLRISGATYIDWNKGHDSVYDLFLMSHCKANIIANSSFSYWGARLGCNNIVIYPHRWFNNQASPNIFDDSWISI